MQIYKTFQYIGTINDRKINLDHNIKQENDLQRFSINNEAIFTFSEDIPIPPLLLTEVLKTDDRCNLQRIHYY